MLIAGRYRLHTALGRGAMGEVWRASDETLGRDVAVKLMLGQDADPTATSRFRLEAQTAGRLHHGNVVGVLDFGEYEGNLFLVMELVAGDSLARILSENGPLPADRVARIAAHTAAGLAVAHDQGIVHRDIKPGNLLVDADGTTKIADFGIARFMDDPGAALTRTGHIVGTSLYLAPERALGQNAGPPSDVYSLGCVLYQLLTGGTPFKGESPVAVLHHHLDTPPVPPRELGVDLPPAFENYLLGLLAKRPEDRPTARQVAEYFGGGAWQGRPEPLPAAAPSGPQGTGRRAAPGHGPGRPEPAAAPRQQRGTGTRAAGRGAPAVGAAPGAGPRHGAGPGSAPSYPGTPSGPGGSAETGPPTTYKLPTAAAAPPPRRTGAGAVSSPPGRRRPWPGGGPGSWPCWPGWRSSWARCCWAWRGSGTTRTPRAPTAAPTPLRPRHRRPPATADGPRPTVGGGARPGPVGPAAPVARRPGASVPRRVRGMRGRWRAVRVRGWWRQRLQARGGRGPDQQDRARGVVHDEARGGPQAVRTQPCAVAVTGEDQQVGLLGRPHHLALGPPPPLPADAGPAEPPGGGVQQPSGRVGPQFRDPRPRIVPAPAEQPGEGPVRDPGLLTPADVQ